MGHIADSRRSPAIIVAVLALVAALAGTAVAGPDASTSALTKSKVKKIAKKQINRLAPGLSVANANTLEGQPASAFASSEIEPYHEVSAPGEPGFENGWANYTAQPNFETAGFYKDPWGVVHLKGVIDGGTNNTVFTLPPGYRPAKNVLEVIHRFSGPASMIVRADGGVAPVLGSNNASLDGVTFRAGG